MTCRFIVVQSSLKEAEKKKKYAKGAKTWFANLSLSHCLGRAMAGRKISKQKKLAENFFLPKGPLVFIYFFALQVRQAKFASILSLFLCVGGRHRPPPPHPADSSAGRRRWVRVAVQSGRRTLVRYELAQELVALVEDALVLLLST